jgi:hypothetical protein
MQILHSFILLLFFKNISCDNGKTMDESNAYLRPIMMWLNGNGNGLSFYTTLMLN